MSFFLSQLGSERARRWRRVGIWWGIWAALVAIDRLFTHQVAPLAGPQPDANSVARSWCAPQREPLGRIVIAAGARRVVVQRQGAHWQRGEHVIPDDLVGAFFESLESCEFWPIVATEAGAWAEFGVAHPVAVVELESVSGSLVQKIAFGHTNPVGTGRYARLLDDPRVFLVGSQQWYYAELLAGTPLDKAP